jgi:hypothetical protein
MEATSSIEKTVAIGPRQTGEDQQVQDWEAEKTADIMGQNSVAPAMCTTLNNSPITFSD